MDVFYRIEKPLKKVKGSLIFDVSWEEFCNTLAKYRENSGSNPWVENEQDDTGIYLTIFDNSNRYQPKK